MFLWLAFIQWPVLGILLAAWGAYSLRRREGARRKLYARWSNVLSAWNISLPEDELSQATRDMQKSWNILLSWGWIGLGVTMTLVGLLRILQLLLTSGSQLSFSVLVQQPAIEIEVFSLIIGYGAGYLHGLWQLRRRSPDRLTYGDLRPKKLTDYHSLAMQCVPVCDLIYLCILLIVSMPTWKEHITIQLISGTSIALPSWVAWTAPCLGVVLIIVAERFLWLVATFPRLFISMDLPLSARLDDMLRSLASASLLTLEYATLGVLNYVQATLLGLSARTPDYVLYMVLVSVSLPPLLWISGLVLIGLLRGRLGGNVNKWPWQYAKSREREQVLCRKTTNIIENEKER